MNITDANITKLRDAMTELQTAWENVNEHMESWLEEKGRARKDAREFIEAEWYDYEVAVRAVAAIVDPSLKARVAVLEQEHAASATARRP